MSALALAFLLAAAAWAAPKNPDTYVYLTIGDASSLDPAWQRDAGSNLVAKNVYDTLYRIETGPEGRIVPMLAAALPKVSADRREYRIPIRKGVLFHDGSVLTPEDVRYSFLRQMLMDRAGGAADLLLEPLLDRPSTRAEDGRILPGIWEAASRSVAVEGDAVVLRLPKPYGPLLGLLASRAPYVVSRSWAAANGDWDGSEGSWQRFNDPPKETTAFFARANGTGPFKLERWDRAGREIVLARHEGYWAGPARLARVVLKAVPELGTRKLMLQAGDADNIYADRAAQSQLEGLEGVRVADGLLTQSVNPVVFFTYRTEPQANSFIGSGRLDGEGVPPDFFADRDARLAFAHALDAERFIAEALRGRGTRASGIIPKGMLGHRAGGPRREFDLKRAEAHLRRAHGGAAWERGFRLVLAYNSGNTTRQIIAQMLKRNVESINPKFKIDVRALDWPAYLDASEKSKLPLFVMGWTGAFPDPHSFSFPLLHSAGVFPQDQGFSKPEFDRLVEQAVAEGDPARRARLYERLQDLAYEEVPHLLVADAEHYRVEREWVRGWVHSPSFPDGPHGAWYYPIWKE